MPGGDEPGEGLFWWAGGWGLLTPGLPAGRQHAGRSPTPAHIAPCMPLSPSLPTPPPPPPPPHSPTLPCGPAWQTLRRGLGAEADALLDAVASGAAPLYLLFPGTGGGAWCFEGGEGGGGIGAGWG
jgi:hypothetical protein